MESNNDRNVILTILPPVQPLVKAELGWGGLRGRGRGRGNSAIIDVRKKN